MTERAQFTAMLTRCGVPFTEDGGRVLITCEDGCGVTSDAPLQGYYLFSASFDFDADGQLVQVGLYE